MPGLKRGVVELADHDPEWQPYAAQIIEKLWKNFGSLAKDIQHIGSTAIMGIKAKPMIDIAVGVKSFSLLGDVFLLLEDDGIYKSTAQPLPGIILCAVKSHRESDTCMCAVHIVEIDSMQWQNHINFRDYLNAIPQKAADYEELKIELANKYPDDRDFYSAGKKEFIEDCLFESGVYVKIREKYEIAFLSPVTKGWSEDKKYRVSTTDGSSYLLRVTPIERLASRKALFTILQQVAALEISMCKLVAFGTCSSGVYWLQTWVNGEDAENRVPLLTETEQYVLGLQSGEILLKIHSLPAPEDQEDWAVRFNRKTDTKIQKYHECGLRFDGDEKVIGYIENNRHLLEGRPQCFQHGDYHIGNMMIENGQLVIIDFDRFDFGDSWEEFNRIVWCAQNSPHFATGMVNGYFDGKPPLDFWKLLAFYIASNTLSSIYWAIPFGQCEIDTMMNQSQDVLIWYDNMHNPVPTWYLPDFYIQYTDGIPYKLKAPYDFSFLKKYGKLFKVYDDQDSGNICFGLTDGENRFFIKFAGAPTERSCVSAEEAVANLKCTVPIYEKLAHPNLITLVNSEEIGGGFALVFEWTDGICMGRMYPLDRKLFMELPLEAKHTVFRDILTFHVYVAEQRYVAIDFYDGSIIYDFSNRRTVICDIDFYARSPYTNNMGRLWGSARFMSPEEFQLGAVIDEITNVFNLGAMAFAFFGSETDRVLDQWKENSALYAVAKRAVSHERNERFQSIAEFSSAWNNAKGEDLSS